MVLTWGEKSSNWSNRASEPSKSTAPVLPRRRSDRLGTGLGSRPCKRRIKTFVYLSIISTSSGSSSDDDASTPASSATRAEPGPSSAQPSACPRPILFSDFHSRLPRELSDNLKLRDSIQFEDPEGRLWEGTVDKWRDGRVCIKHGWNKLCKWNKVSTNDTLICEFLPNQKSACEVIRVQIIHPRS